MLGQGLLAEGEGGTATRGGGETFKDKKAGNRKQSSREQFENGFVFLVTMSQGGYHRAPLGGGNLNLCFLLEPSLTWLTALPNL